MPDAMEVPPPTSAPILLPEFANTVSDLLLRDGSVPDRLVSQLCRSRELAGESFKFWLKRLQIPYQAHRKHWELAFITHAMAERGLLVPGRRGLGFAVGQERLPALFAAMGCTITATDLGPDDQRTHHWTKGNQWSAQKAQLNSFGICPADEFDARVEFERADMADIPANLNGYDFSWSTCSFEHIGNAEAGAEFLSRQMRCLKPGGWSMHTTEFNLTSDDETLDVPHLYVYRLRDIAMIVRRLRAEGHFVEPLDIRIGDEPDDWHVDTIDPALGNFAQKRHMRLQLGRYACTSIGLIIRKADEPAIREGS